MSVKQILFFCDLDDLRPIILNFEELNQIHYYQTGLLETEIVPHYQTALEFPDLGFVNAGDWNHINNYLILNQNTDIKIRKAPQKRGGVRYAVDQRENQESVSFKPAGILREGVMIAGTISTLHDDLVSKRFMRCFYRRFRKDCKKVGDFYVGKNALEKLQSGWRLTQSVSSPVEYDLVLS